MMMVKGHSEKRMLQSGCKSWSSIRFLNSKVTKFVVCRCSHASAYPIAPETTGIGTHQSPPFSSSLSLCNFFFLLNIAFLFSIPLLYVCVLLNLVFSCVRVSNGTIQNEFLRVILSTELKQYHLFIS